VKLAKDLPTTKDKILTRRCPPNEVREAGLRLADAHRFAIQRDQRA
jgi:hypothetical protein